MHDTKDINSLYLKCAPQVNEVPTKSTAHFSPERSPPHSCDPPRESRLDLPERIFRLLNDSGEALLVEGREIREDSTVKLNACLLKPTDEAAVVDPVRTHRGVDTDDPEAAESTLALAPVAVRVAEPSLDRLDGAPEEPSMCPSITSGELKDSVMTTAGFKASFCSWHLLTLGGYVAPTLNPGGLGRALLGFSSCAVDTRPHTLVEVISVDLQFFIILGLRVSRRGRELGAYW